MGHLGLSSSDDGGCLKQNASCEKPGKQHTVMRFQCSEVLEQKTLVTESRSVVAYSWGQGGRLQRGSKELFGVMKILCILM